MPYEMLTDFEIRKPIDNFASEFPYPEHEKVSFKMLPDIHIPNHILDTSGYTYP